MGSFERIVRSDLTPSESFTSFVEEVEPRLKRALCVGFGIESGVEATADALAYGWEHWERIETMENPAGYLYQVGRSRARKRRTPRPDFLRRTAPPTPRSGSSPHGQRQPFPSYVVPKIPGSIAGQVGGTWFVEPGPARVARQ